MEDLSIVTVIWRIFVCLWLEAARHAITDATNRPIIPDDYARPRKQKELLYNNAQVTSTITSSDEMPGAQQPRGGVHLKVYMVRFVCGPGRDD